MNMELTTVLLDFTDVLTVGEGAKQKKYVCVLSDTAVTAKRAKPNPPVLIRHGMPRHGHHYTEEEDRAICAFYRSMREMQGGERLRRGTLTAFARQLGRTPDSISAHYSQMSEEQKRM